MNIPYLRQYFPAAKLYGCDVSEKSIGLAKSQIDYCQFDVIETLRDIKMYDSKQPPPKVVALISRPLKEAHNTLQFLSTSVQLMLHAEIFFTAFPHEVTL
jgi:hypothetical protein